MVHAAPGWPGERDVQDELWELAERHTPDERVADYTQAIMDLGAPGPCVYRSLARHPARREARSGVY
jgi:hypothetical protein